METQPTTSPPLTLVAAERVPSSPITATVVTRSSMHTYEVHELQVDHACLRGGPALPRRQVFDVIFHVPFYPQIRVHARLTGADQRLRISLIHTDDYTEDHIQAALLSELERRDAPN
jgi:hypothetical protein